MAQINFNALSNMVPVDYAGSVARGHQANKLAAESQSAQSQTQIDNTKLLYLASGEIMNNPQAAGRWIPELQKRGVIDPKLDMSQLSPEQIQKEAATINQSVGKALQGMNTLGTAANQQKSFAPIPMVKDGVVQWYSPTVGADGTPIMNPYQVGGEARSIKETPQQESERKVREAINKKAGQSEVDLDYQPRITEENERAKLRVVEESKQTGFGRTLDEVRPLYDTLKTKDLSLIYGRGEAMYPEIMRSQEGIDLLSQRNQYVALLQLAAAGKLKGQGTITDSERKTLTESATILSNLNISAGLARKALDDSIAILEKQSGADDKGGLKPGMVEDGYRFIGGNPSDPKSWVKVK